MTLLQDWRANEQLRIRVALVLFRLAQSTRERFGRRSPVALAAAVVHHWFATVVVGFELPVSVEVGPRLTIWHGFGIVVNSGTRLGAGVQLRHGVTLGGDGRRDGCPVLGDGVEVGVGASIIGPVHIGSGALIGAHALVLDDVPAGGRARAARAEVEQPRSPQ